MALADVSKKLAKGTVAATALPAFMAYQGLSAAVKPISRAVLPKNILTSFANELDYFPLKAGFDTIYNSLGWKKRTNTTTPPPSTDPTPGTGTPPTTEPTETIIGNGSDDPVPVIVKNTDEIKTEERPLIERLPSGFFSQMGNTSSLNRESSIDILLKKTNELLEEIKNILSGQLLIQQNNDRLRRRNDPIDRARAREDLEESRRGQPDITPANDNSATSGDSSHWSLLGGLALLTKGATIAGLSALVLTPFIETFVNNLAQGLDLKQMIPGETGQMLDDMIKNRAGDFAGKVTTFIGARFLFGTKAAMLSVFADELIRQFENITDLDIPNEYEGAISIAAGALAAKYGKSIVTKLIPSINKTLALRFAGILSAISLVNAIPDNAEDLQKFMEDNKKSADGLNSQIYEKIGKPINNLLGFELIREKEDYENSMANKMFTGVFDSAGMSPREMEIQEQILQAGLTGRAGKMKDDFEIGRAPTPRTYVSSDYYIDPAYKKGIVPETPETINKNNQTLLNDRTGKSPNVLQYNDNRTYNTQTRTGGSSGGATGNVPVSTTPPASSWTKRESIIRPH